MSTESQKMLKAVEKIFSATEKTVSDMSDSARIQVKDLAEKVAAEVGMKAKDVLNFVTYFLHENDGLAHVVRGKSGGVKKGPKPVKAAPTVSSDTDEVSSNETSDSDE